MYLIFDIFKQWLKLNYVKSRNTLHGPGLNHRRIGQNKHFAQISATTGAKNKHFPAVDDKNKILPAGCQSVIVFGSIGA